MKKILTLLTLSLAFHAFADNHKNNRPKAMGACKETIAKFCADVKEDPTHTKGDGKLAACIKSHEAEITEPSCKDHLANIKERREDRRAERKEFWAACKSDLKAHCGDVEKGKGRKVQCLKDKAASGTAISDTCKAELNDMGATKNPSQFYDFSLQKKRRDSRRFFAFIVCFQMP